MSEQTVPLMCCTCGHHCGEKGEKRMNKVTLAEFTDGELFLLWVVLGESIKKYDPANPNDAGPLRFRETVAAKVESAWRVLAPGNATATLEAETSDIREPRKPRTRTRRAAPAREGEK